VADRLEWQLIGFDEWLEIWELNEPASGALDALRFVVISWILSRGDDPYKDAQPDPAAPGLWFAEIPGSYHDGQVVVCTYWIEETTHTVRCIMLGTLSWPV